MSLYTPFGTPYIATTAFNPLPLSSSYPTTYLSDLYQQMIKKNDYTGTIPTVPLIYSNNNNFQFICSI